MSHTLDTPVFDTYTPSLALEPRTVFVVPRAKKQSEFVKFFGESECLTTSQLRSASGRMRSAVPPIVAIVQRSELTSRNCARRWKVATRRRLLRFCQRQF